VALHQAPPCARLDARRDDAGGGAYSSSFGVEHAALAASKASTFWSMVTPDSASLMTARTPAAAASATIAATKVLKSPPHLARRPGGEGEEQSEGGGFGDQDLLSWCTPPHPLIPAQREFSPDVPGPGRVSERGTGRQRPVHDP